jgi:hypothetical protein
MLSRPREMASESRDDVAGLSRLYRSIWTGNLNDRLSCKQEDTSHNMLQNNFLMYSHSRTAEYSRSHLKNTELRVTSQASYSPEYITPTQKDHEFQVVSQKKTFCPLNVNWERFFDRSKSLSCVGINSLFFQRVSP